MFQSITFQCQEGSNVACISVHSGDGLEMRLLPICMIEMFAYICMFRYVKALALSLDVTYAYSTLNSMNTACHDNTPTKHSPFILERLDHNFYFAITLGFDYCSGLYTLSVLLVKCVVINPRRACAGGLRYLSCLSVCLSVTT